MQVLLHMREASVSAVMSEDRVLPQVSHLAQTASLMTLALSSAHVPPSQSHCLTVMQENSPDRSKPALHIFILRARRLKSLITPPEIY